MTVFVDTNVLVYARDAAQHVKQPVAKHWMDRLWETSQGRLSTQVLNEYYVTVTRKLDRQMPIDDARADVLALVSWQPLVVDAALTVGAWRIQDAYKFSFWDSLIVAAAQAVRCTHLLTEDLNDGQALDGLIVINPFTHDPAEVLPV